MAKRSEVITRDSLSGLFRHHPYLQILQKEDWQEYLLILSEIYDLLEEQGSRVSMDVVRSLVLNFYSTADLVSPEQKVTTFFNMAIAELQVLKDSHDQFGRRYLEATRFGKFLLQLFEGLIAQRNKFSGTGAETLLGALNDILISRRQMNEDEAILHHKERIEAFKDDIIRIKKEGLAAAQLLPIAHSNEALFVQAEESAIHVLQSIEDVKSSVEQLRQELASVYFGSQRSAGETLSAVADFYESLYSSPAYMSYVHAKDLLSYLEGFQARFSTRNIDRLLHTIEDRNLVPADVVKKSNLNSFMHQFAVSDTSIQEKIKSQIRILQNQVLYAISTDMEGLRSILHDVISQLVSNADSAQDFCQKYPVTINSRDEFEFGPLELFDFELPVEVASETLAEETFDRLQERELFLSLIRAEEGTLNDILGRLREYIRRHGYLRASEFGFSRGLAEYYVLSEGELFDPSLERIQLKEMDLMIESKYGAFIMRRVTDFILRKKESHEHGPI